MRDRDWTMMLALTVVLTALALIVGISGCGDHEDEEWEYPTYPDFFAEHIKLDCQYWVICSPGTYDYPSWETCVDTFMAAFDSSWSAWYVSNEGDLIWLTYHPDKAQECIDELADRYADLPYEYDWTTTATYHELCDPINDLAPPEVCSEVLDEPEVEDPWWWD